MQIVLVDSDNEQIGILNERVDQAVKQAALRRVKIEACHSSQIAQLATNLDPDGIILGPGTFDECEQLVDKLKSIFPNANIAIVLQNDVYAIEAVRLRRLSGVRVIPIADIANLAHFLLDSFEISRRSSGGDNEGIIGVAQLKGGVGCSTVAAALAACRASYGDSIALVDLDDTNPQLTDWARVGVGKRSVVAELLRAGQVPPYRLAECLHSIEEANGVLSIVGQPENYHESFHFKADVLEGAPSSQVFIESLLPQLREQFDMVVIDFGRSWGVSQFASLPFCQEVLLVLDDDALTLKRTIDSLRRLSRESEDKKELDFSKWRVVMNAYTGRLLSPNDVSDEFDDSGVFPESADLHVIPFSEKGRQWGAPGKTFYDLAEEPIRREYAKLANEILPLKEEFEGLSSPGVLGQLKRLAGM